MIKKWFYRTFGVVLILTSIYLSLVVSDSEAQLALIVNPFIEIQRVQGQMPMGERAFGGTVSISKTTAIVGAFRDNPLLRGRAFVFERDEMGFWSEEQVLTASNSEDRDFFGNCVSVSEDMAIIGASQTPFPPPLVPGPGKSLIFERDLDGVWNEVAILIGSDAVFTDTQGLTCDIDGINGRAIMGSPRPPSNTFEGKAYIFERDMMGNWNEAAILSASDAMAGDFFANKVSIDGDTVMVGAPFADQAYVFERDIMGNWNETQILTPSDGMSGDFFGSDIVHRGAYMIVGAQGADSGEGKAYIFEKDMLGIWNEVQILTPSSPIMTEIYASNVSISEDIAVVGASLPTTTPGRAYIYKRDDMGMWNELEIINPSDGMPNDQFGVEVSVSGNQIVIGAQGVNGAMGEDFLGAAYFFGGPADLEIEIIDDGIGSGSVTSMPGGIDCQADCLQDYQYQTLVTLLAIPDPGSKFVEWTGDCSGEASDTSILIIEDSLCVAEFMRADFVLNAISPALDDNINSITSEVATPGGRVAFIWGKQLGSFTIGGQICRGTNLGIKAPNLLAIARANEFGIATYVFYIPTFNDLNFEIQLQAIDIGTCRTSNIVPQIIRKDESG